MAYRKWALKYPKDVTGRITRSDYVKAQAAVLECLDGPLWHRLEEALK